MTFLVARPSPKAQLTQFALQQAGLKANVAPVLKVNILADSELRDKFLNDRAEIMVITSTYAVDWLNQQALTIDLSQYKIVCIGQSTADALTSNVSNQAEKASLHNTFILPELENSEGVLALPLMQNLANKSIVILKGEGGRDLIKKGAQSRGAKVKELCVYRRTVQQKPAFDFNLNAIKCIIVTSVEIAEACFALFDPVFLQNIHWMVASQRIKDYAIQQGVVSISQSRGASQNAIVECALYLVHTGVVND
jgi:uroporphyrinogen-III synthase